MYKRKEKKKEKKKERERERKKKRKDGEKTSLETFSRGERVIAVVGHAKGAFLKLTIFSWETRIIRRNGGHVASHVRERRTLLSVMAERSQWEIGSLIINLVGYISPLIAATRR